jgi:hypothetical protein
MNWISVKDKPFPKDRPFLVYAYSENKFNPPHSRSYFCVVQIEDYGDGNPFMTSPSVSGYEWQFDFNEKDITHWSELEKPQE